MLVSCCHLSQTEHFPPSKKSLSGSGSEVGMAERLTWPSRGAPFLHTLLFLLFWSASTNADVVIINPDNQTEKVFIDYELTFTAPVPSDGIQGLVQVANPPDGCTDIQKPPFATNTSLKWFVLVERQHCSYEIQVKNAQAGGYQAAIIYHVGPNNQPQNRVVTPDLDSDIEIPGILIGQDDGKKMKLEYTYKTGYTVIINPDSAFNLNTYLLPFAIVIGFCFIIMLLFMVIKCIKDRRRSRRNRLSSRHLKHLPTTKYKNGDKYEICAVCLEDYCEGEKLRILPCSHAYHTKCIDPWLTNNRRNCPICKRKVAIPGVTPDSDSDSETDQDVSETTPLLQSSSNGSSSASQALSTNMATTRTNGGTFCGSTSSSRCTGNQEDSEGGSLYRSLVEGSEPGPSSRSSSYQEVPDMHSGTRGKDNPNREEDIYHTSSSNELLTPDNRHSINGEEDDETPPVMVVVAATAENKATKKSRSELVV